MADIVKISGFERSALEQLASYIGKNMSGVTKDIRNAASSNSESSNTNDEISVAESSLKNLNNELKEFEKLRKQAEQNIQKYTDSNIHGAEKKRKTAEAEYAEIQRRIGVLKTESELIKSSIKQIKKRNDAQKDGEATISKISSHEEHINNILSERIKLQEHLNEIEDRAYKVSRKKWIEENPKQVENFLKKQERIAVETGRVGEYLDRKTLAGKLFGSYMREHAERGHKNSVAQGITSGAITGIGNGLSKAVNFLGSDQQQTISGVGGQIANIAGMFGPWGKAAGAAVQAVTAIVEQYDKINKASSDYARSVGGGAAKMQTMKTDATQVAYSISKWGGLAYKFDKIMQHLSELSEKTGRVMDHMSEMDIKSLEDLTRHGITSDVLNQYDTFGLSMERIDERVTSIYKTSGKHGLNAKAVTDTVNKNLKMAQQYTFAGGQRALERMAEKAVALKYNMESVARFADKVSTLEGAAQSAASLSVLGGDFARMANPLSLLYGGIQDPERLNEMMLNMTKNMAHWDSQNGELRITGENRMRLRQAAEAMGVSYEDLINQSYSQGKRRMIDRDLDKTGKFNDEDTREYIRNLAQLDEKGRAYIRFSGEEENTYLDKLTPADKERLRKESEAMEQKDKAKIGDVYVETRTITERLNDYIDFIKTTFFNFLQKWAGLSDENTAQAKGLNAKNAEFFEDLSDDFWWGGLSNEGLKRLTELGLSEKSIDYQKIASNKDITQEEFDDILLNLILKKQGEGFQYKGNKGWEYGQNKSFEEGWEKIKREEENKKAYGGIIRGKGTSKSDSIPAWLSNGEFVVNASATSKHLPELQAMNAESFSSGTITPIRAGKNQYNLGTSVLPPMSMSNVGVGGVQHVTIDPLQVSGTLTLNVAGGGSKTINANELFTQENINILLRKLQESLGFRLDKTEFRMPKFM